MWWAAQRPVEPDAGWGGVVALAVAVAVFWGAISFHEHVWKPFRRSFNPPRKGVEVLPGALPAVKSGRGQLYVIEFSTGTVKVGKSGRGGKRIDEHISDATKYGAAVLNQWISPVHAGYDLTETELIARCAAEGEQIKREWFRGLPFARAVALAEAVIAEREGVREGASEEVGQGAARGLSPWLLAMAQRILTRPSMHPAEGMAIDMLPATTGPQPPPAGFPAVAPAVLYTPVTAGTVATVQAPAATLPPGEHGPTIQQVLDVNGLDGRVVRFVAGPVVSRYEVALQPTVPVEHLRRLASRIASACRVARVEVALVPGRGTAAVEVPNLVRGQVLLADVLAEAGADPMILGLGRSVDGIMAPSLRKLPHLLVGGASGTGKSTLINACVCSLLRSSPEQVGLVLIDPHQVELAAYANVPHLAMALVTEARHAASALEWVGHEMQLRSGLFVEAGVKDIDAYNDRVAAGQLAGPALRYLVVVVDELATLTTGATRDDVEDP